MLGAKRVVADATVQSRNCSGSLSGIATGPVPAASATDASGSRSCLLDRDGQYLASSRQGMFVGDIQIGEARMLRAAFHKPLRIAKAARPRSNGRGESEREPPQDGHSRNFVQDRRTTGVLPPEAIIPPAEPDFLESGRNGFPVGAFMEGSLSLKKTTTRMAPALLGPFLFGRCRHLGWHHGLRSG